MGWEQLEHTSDEIGHLCGDKATTSTETWQTPYSYKQVLWKLLHIKKWF